MDKKNKDILKKGLHEAKSDFTSNLMDKIQAEEKALNNVLSRTNVLETSDDFTDSLMSKLEGKVPAKPYAPIISKAAWMGIAAVFAGLISIALFSSGLEAGSFKFDLQVERITEGVRSLFQYSQAITYTCFGILILTLGLLFEQRLKKTT